MNENINEGKTYSFKGMGFTFQVTNWSGGPGDWEGDAVMTFDSEDDAKRFLEEADYEIVASEIQPQLVKWGLIPTDEGASGFDHRDSIQKGKTVKGTYMFTAA